MVLALRLEAEKMLSLTNNDVRPLLNMEMTINVLKQSYQEIADGEGISRPGIDLRFSNQLLPSR